MSTPPLDLSKVQYTSLANSFKNDRVYTGTLTISAAIPAGSFLTASSTTTLSVLPQFSMLYANFQEYMDAFQQFNFGSGYNTAQWYQAGINNRLGVVVTTAPFQGVIDGMIYSVINGNQVTVTAIINNPYGSTINYNALSIPWCLFCYSTAS
jgi:hypothetical protein